MFSNQGCSTNQPLKKKAIPEVIEIDLIILLITT